MGGGERGGEEVLVAGRDVEEGAAAGDVEPSGSFVSFLSLKFSPLLPFHSRTGNGNNDSKGEPYL